MIFLANDRTPEPTLQAISGTRRVRASTVRWLHMLAAGVLAGSLASQTAWQVTATPNYGAGAYCYDMGRSRMVFLTSRGDTYEKGPSTGWNWTAAGAPWMSGWFGGIAYDRTRQRVVMYDGLRTWTWDGTAWLLRPTAPNWTFLHVVAHEKRGTVMAFGGASNPWTANDLYEWNGTTWVLVPTINRPPRPGNASASQVYLRSAYDARRDKLVLFGTAWVDWASQRPTNLQPTIWEWDITNGWVNRAVQGTIGDGYHLYFDSQRGVLTKFQGNPVEVAEWDGGSAWQNIVPATGAPSWYVRPRGAYEPLQGQVFVGLVSVSGDVAYTYGTVNVAAFDSIAPGCPGTLGEPTLRLTHNWTRAWMGRTLSVDLQNLPQSTGFVATGWSNQQAGSFQLPFDLTPYAMPGCFVRVSTDLLQPVAGTANTATLTMAVPNHPTLLGVTLYQQGFALDPAANPAGLTAGNAVRITIGRL